jgi:two-component system clock-associated histidine kinase SasA
MASSVDLPATRLSIQLLLFVNSRSTTQELADQIRRHLEDLPGDYPTELEVVEIGERPYLAEHYRLVATPALVKVHPLPAQVLAGEDLTTQLEVWWTRWQGQVMLMSNSRDAGQEPHHTAPSAALLQMSEDIFNLRQERAQLLEQLKFKDRILAMLAHDLRSPLTATSLAVETLQQQEHELTPELVQHLFEQARQQLRKMDTMITDILEAARGTSAELLIHPGKVQLADLCWSTLQDFRHRMEAKQLTLQTDIPTDLPLVHADDNKIRQVIANLLDNAIKYTPAHGTIRLQVLHRTTQKVQVTISDTGPGIPTEDQRVIFTDTVRLLRDQQKEGYGIGLSLCRRIVRAHYGQIWVESYVGEGSSFHFTLPVYRV